ncbi:hypothetical protein B0H19DRAFT_1271384 [Mycena capillaripes]|nr:hypothetical protein B0H19DRAFT_1271384 [Mycena capillaripes]
MSSHSDLAIQQRFELSRYLVFIPLTILGSRTILGHSHDLGVFFYLNRYSARFGTVPLLAEILLTTSDPSKAGRIIHILRELHGTRLLATERSATTLDSELKAFGCPSPTPHESNTRTAAAWAGMLVFDIMIFLLTLYKALRYETRAGSLFRVLFRDGCMYFSIMIAANAINIGTYTMPILSGGGAVLAVNALSSVLVTRLMLNLCDPKILRAAQSDAITGVATRDLPVFTTIMDP